MGCFHPQNATRNINEDSTTTKQSLKKSEHEKQENPSVPYMKQTMPNIIINSLADVVIQQKEKHNYTIFYTEAPPEMLFDMIENLEGHLKKNDYPPGFTVADILNKNGIQIRQGDLIPSKSRNEDILVIEQKRPKAAFYVKRVHIQGFQEEQIKQILEIYEEKTKLQKEKHRGILNAFDILSSDDYLYIVLEFIPFTLAQYIDTFKGAVREDFLLSFFSEGISTLNYILQSRKTFPVPCLSLGNVWIDMDGSLKLNFVPNFTKLEDLSKTSCQEDYMSPEYRAAPFEKDVDCGVLESSLLFSFGLIFLSVTDFEITKKFQKSWNQNQKDLEICLEAFGKKIPECLLPLVRRILSWNPEDRSNLSQLNEECLKEKINLCNLIKEKFSQTEHENVHNFENFLEGDTKIVVQASDKRLLLDAGLLPFSPVFMSFTGFFQKIPSPFYSSDSLLLIEDFYRIYDFDGDLLERDAEFFDMDKEPALFSEALNEKHKAVFKRIMISETKFNLEKTKNVLTCSVTLGFHHFSRILFRAQIYSSFHDLDPVQLKTYQKLFEISHEIEESKMRALLKITIIKNPLLFIDKFYANV